MTHILFVTGEYPPQQGGVGAYTAELGKALIEQGAQVSVVTSRSVEPDSADSRHGIRVHNSIERWHWNIWREIGDLAAQIDADWIHVQYQTAAFNMNPAINFAPWQWRRSLSATKVAWTYHDLLVPYLFPKAGKRVRNWVTLRPARSSDLTIVTNEGDRFELRDKQIAHLHKIVIGSNIQRRTLSEQERRARRAERGYDDEDRILAYFGFLNRSKGALTLIRALGRLAEAYPTTQLLMIGERVGASDPTNYAYLQEVEALIAGLGLGGRVRWTGRQPDAEVAADLNACDVLVMPYVDGASPRRGTLMAGLANGCAIVTTTPQAPMPELVDERDLLYVAPENDAALAKITRRLFDTPRLADKLRHNARQASRQFDWRTIAAEHMARYEQLR